MSNTLRDAGLVLALIGTIAGGAYKFVAMEKAVELLEVRLSSFEERLKNAEKTDEAVANFVNACTDTFKKVVAERKANGGTNFAEQTSEMLYRLECDNIVTQFVN